MIRTIFVAAGEASGDMLGAHILRAFCKTYPEVEINGIGGPWMEEAGGFTSLFPLKTFSHLGFFSILRHYPQLRKAFYDTVQAVVDRQPQLLLTLDAPEFSLRLGREVHKRCPTLPRLHCVAPSVWAWRPRRAFTTIPQGTDHLLTLFPFESAFFSHMRHTFVGHPVLQRPKGCGQNARKRWGLSEDQPLVTFLPGSRPKEIQAFFPLFLEVAKKLTTPFAFATPPNMIHLVRHIWAERGPSHLLDHLVLATEEQEKSDLFAASTLAVAASGTVSLELAFHQTPMIIGYRMGMLTAWIARRLVRTPWISLVNILAQQEVVPELLQEDFEENNLLHHIKTFLASPILGQQQKEKFHSILQPLYSGQPFGLHVSQILGQTLNGIQDSALPSA